MGSRRGGGDGEPGKASPSPRPSSELGRPVSSMSHDGASGNFLPVEPLEVSVYRCRHCEDRFLICAPTPEGVRASAAVLQDDHLRVCSGFRR